MVTSSLLLLSGIAAFAFGVGVLIGVVGIGGILLIPFLVYVIGVDIHTVITSCMAGFVVSGWVAVYCYARKGSIRWDKAVFLILGAAPGAYLGSITVWALPAFVLEFIVIAFVLVSGINSLRKKLADRHDSGIDSVPNLALVLLGLAVGYGSSVSGTGGPLLLVPSLLFLHFPVLTTVGLSMAIQLVIAPFATIGHILHGTIDWVLAIPVAIGVSTGVVLGAEIAHKISLDSLRKVVAVSLLVCGASITVKYLV